MMIVGIDPGLSGAIAYMEQFHRSVEDMPVMGKPSGKGNQVNPYRLHDLIMLHGRPERAIVEQVSAMPGQGVTSMFSFGKSAGIIEGILAAEKIPMILITPQRWKKQFGLIGKDKDAARTIAIQLFPEIAGQLQRKKDVGRADAVLISYYWILLSISGAETKKGHAL